MCKTSHIYLKLTHQNYLCHSETLAFPPRLASDIGLSAFRPANYVFWRATFKGSFSCGRARCKTCSFLLSSTSISRPKFNFSFRTHVICQFFNIIYFISCSKCLMLYISETGRQAIDREICVLWDAMTLTNPSTSISIVQATLISLVKNRKGASFFLLVPSNLEA